MNDGTYLRAELDDITFAIPAAEVMKILTDTVTAAVPGAPRGICGVIYSGQAVFAVRSLSESRTEPAKLVVLCRDEDSCAAFAADRVDTLGELDNDELTGARPVEKCGILLLDRKGQDG